MSERIQFLNNHAARVSVTPNQEWTMKMRDEVLSNVGAQDMETLGFQVSDLEYIEFHWEDPNLNMDAIFRPDIDTPLSPPSFKF